MPAGCFDVLVAGAGPAGAIAARQLALSGFSVVLADGGMPRSPKLGETLPGAALRLLKRLGLSLFITGDDSRNATFASHLCGYRPVGGTLVEWGDVGRVSIDAINDPFGRGVRIDRAPFDAYLRQAALTAGAYFHASNALRIMQQGPSWGAVFRDGWQVTARWIVDATGRRCRLARLIGQRQHRGAPLVALYRTGQPERNGSLNKTLVMAGADGWVYCGRVGDDRWVIGYHTTPKQAAMLHAEPSRWEHAITANVCLADVLGHVALDSPVCVHAAGSAWLDKPVGDGWIACGDAALAFDPIAGQGLFNALYTGKTVAEVIESIRGGTDRRSEYNLELSRIGGLYAARRRALYREERRWPERPFWRMHRI